MQVVRALRSVKVTCLLFQPIHSESDWQEIFATHSALCCICIFSFDGDWLSFTHPCRYYSSSGKSSNVTELSVVILATLITFDLCQWLQHSAHGLSWNSDIFSQLHCNWPSKHVGWNSESRLVDKFRPVFSDEKGCFFLLVRESHYSKIYWHDYGVTV